VARWLGEVERRGSGTEVTAMMTIAMMTTTTTTTTDNSHEPTPAKRYARRSRRAGVEETPNKIYDANKGESSEAEAVGGHKTMKLRINRRSDAREETQKSEPSSSKLFDPTLGYGEEEEELDKEEDEGGEEEEEVSIRSGEQGQGAMLASGLQTLAKQLQAFGHTDLTPFAYGESEGAGGYEDVDNFDLCEEEVTAELQQQDDAATSHEESLQPQPPAVVPQDAEGRKSEMGAGGQSEPKHKLDVNHNAKSSNQQDKHEETEVLETKGASKSLTENRQARKTHDEYDREEVTNVQKSSESQRSTGLEDDKEDADEKGSDPTGEEDELLHFLSNKIVEDSTSPDHEDVPQLSSNKKV